MSRSEVNISAESITKPVQPWRVVIKATVLFIIFNLLFALLHPSLGWFILIGRKDYQRFPALWIPTVHSNGKVTTERELFSNMDLLFASHVLARGKSEDEFRVFLYGDSSVWGTALFSSQTLAAQINSMHLYTCSGQRVVAYNLGYPSNSATKDLLFMQRAQEYEPDLNVWLFSMLAFQNVRQDVPFVVDNPLAVYELMYLYDLPHDTDQLAPAPNSFLDATLYGQRQDLNMLIRLQASTLLLTALGMDDPRIMYEAGVHVQDAPKSTEDFLGILPPADLRDYLAYETLPVATAITRGKIIYVGEPIEISSGEYSHIAYNSFFPIWAYDQFRDTVAGLAMDNGWTYLDYWNLIPEHQFSTSIFHLNAEGERALAAELAQAILAAACP